MTSLQLKNCSLSFNNADEGEEVENLQKELEIWKKRYSSIAECIKLCLFERERILKLISRYRRIDRSTNKKSLEELNIPQFNGTENQAALKRKGLGDYKTKDFLEYNKKTQEIKTERLGRLENIQEVLSNWIKEYTAKIEIIAQKEEKKRLIKAAEEEQKKQAKQIEFIARINNSLGVPPQNPKPNENRRVSVA